MQSFLVICAQAFFIRKLWRIVLALSHLSDSFFSGKSLLGGQIAERYQEEGVFVMGGTGTFPDTDNVSAVILGDRPIPDSGISSFH